MGIKQDLTGARTPADLERRWAFGKSFAEIMGIAKSAKVAAKNAEEAAENPGDKLKPEDIFNLLTDDGENQGVYKKDGKVYINASYIKTGSILADLIKTGVIVSADGKTYFDLNSGTIRCDAVGGGFIEIADGMASFVSNDGRKTLDITNYGFGASINFYNLNGETSAMLMGADNDLYLSVGEVDAKLSWKSNGDGTYTLIGKK